MTVREALELTDRRRPNLYSREEKLRWLSEAEGMVWGALEAFHAVLGPFPGLESSDWPNRKLLLPQAYTGLYFLWLEGSMYYAMTRFNALWRDFFAWCCRTIPQPAKSIRYL